MFPNRVEGRRALEETFSFSAEDDACPWREDYMQKEKKNLKKFKLTNKLVAEHGFLAYNSCSRSNA